jgi:hypothetical protein
MWAIALTVGVLIYAGLIVLICRFLSGVRGHRCEACHEPLTVRVVDGEFMVVPCEVCARAHHDDGVEEAVEGMRDGLAASKGRSDWGWHECA